MNKDKLLIVDGHNLLFQMFFGMPSRIVNHEGRPIQGIIGFVGALLKIIRQIKPQYLVVLFDGEHDIVSRNRFPVMGNLFFFCHVGSNMLRLLKLKFSDECENIPAVECRF